MPRQEEEEVAGLDITLEEHPHPRQKDREAPCETPQGEPFGSLQKDSEPHPSYKASIFQDAPP